MKSPILITSLLFSVLNVSGQTENSIDWNGYLTRISSADSLFNLNQFQKSAENFSKAFVYSDQGFMAGHRYRAACAWANAGRADSAMYNLSKEVSFSFYDYQKLMQEKAFESLHVLASWDSVVVKVKANYEAEMKKAGRFLKVRMELEEINRLDQKYRSNYIQVWQKFGEKSDEFRDLQKKMNAQDLENLKKISVILDLYGWISYDSIGFTANQTLFLVIQHADSASQEKYLPMLRTAVRQGKAYGHQLALLEDRVLIKKGKKQIYGSQIQCDSTGKNCWVLPIEDEKNVDIRRAEFGMEPLAEYVKSWNIIYRRPD